MNSKSLRKKSKHEIKKELSVLRHTVARLYRISSRSTEAIDCGQWLSDNFHIIAAEAQGAEEALLSLSGKVSLFDEARQAAHSLADSAEKLTADLVDRLWKGKLVETQVILLLIPCLKADLICRLLHAAESERAEAVAPVILNLLAVREWDAEFFIRRYSGGEKILMEDPGECYCRMDARSRSNYRTLCLKYANQENKSESSFAESLIRKCLNAEDPRERHIGYELVEHTAEKKRKRQRGILFLLLRWCLPIICAILLSVLSGPVYLMPLYILPLYELFRPLLEWLALIRVPAAVLPKIALQRIPEEAKTVVAVSTLVPAPDRTDEFCRHMEELCRSNKNGSVVFCVLADMKESATRECSGDEAAAAALIKGIDRLNEQFGNCFALIIRRRVYVKTQRCFAPRERKRGAILALAGYIVNRDSSEIRFSRNLAVLSKCKYMMLLDTDTAMNMDTLLCLVSAAEHPLNAPQTDSQGRVIRGFGILEPAIETKSEGTQCSLFSAIISAGSGFTNYHNLRGNFYQDLFGESIFTGKGLVNIEVFLQCAASGLPPERILSHDVLEGGILRCGFVSDAEIADGVPKGTSSYFKRLHRWIRGDLQNVPWIFKKAPANAVSQLGRVFMLDNFLRDFSLLFNGITALCAPFLSYLSAVPAVLSILSSAAGEFFSLFLTSLHVLWTRLRMRATANFPRQLAENLLHILIKMMMILPAAAIFTDAALRILDRSVRTKLNFLEWTTAADADRAGKPLPAEVIGYILSVVAGLLYLFVLQGIYILPGLVFLSSPLVFRQIDKHRKRRIRHPVGDAEHDLLIEYASRMWQYYEDFCTAEHHFLPPDNVQEAPVSAVADRTSPTNIGFYLLSCLCAEMMGITGPQEALTRIGQTLSTVEALEKWHGNLLNWYHTRTARPLSPRYCSTVDSGNFVCLLTALRNGLKTELFGERETAVLVERIDRLVAETDLAALYQSDKKLFHIGYDLERKVYSASYYDLLMSEARMTSYYAVSSRQVPSEHWQSLSRALGSKNGVCGPLSWSGTMFEYLMPAILIPTPADSMSAAGIRYCLYCQQLRAKKTDTPFGCSESGYYAFDDRLNYKYKAHGIQQLGLQRRLNEDLVISPYSSFLALPFCPPEALVNLLRIRNRYGIGKYGFYESIDFTPSRVNNGYAVVQSYMAHHIGMSLCSVTNRLFENKLQVFFMQGQMKSGKCLLQEQLPRGTRIMRHGINGIPEPQMKTPDAIHERVSDFYPLQPRVRLYSNHALTFAVTDSGCNFLLYRGKDATRRASDPFASPQGIFAGFSMQSEQFFLTPAPQYQSEASHHAEFSSSAASYYAIGRLAEAGLSFHLDSHRPLLYAELRAKNHTSRRRRAEFKLYLEPVLSDHADYIAHKTFSKLFVEEKSDPEICAVCAARKATEQHEGMALAAGFADNEAFGWTLNKEACLTRPDGAASLLRTDKNQSSLPAADLPDACLCLTFSMDLPAHGQKSRLFCVSVAGTAEDALSYLSLARKNDFHHFADTSVLFGNDLRSRLTQALLPPLLFPAGRQVQPAPSLGDLWAAGISGDFPLALLFLPNREAELYLRDFIRLHQQLKNCGILFDLCICHEPDDYRGSFLSAFSAAMRHMQCEDLLGKPGGIHLCDRAVLGEQSVEAIRCAAAIVVDQAFFSTTFLPKPVKEGQIVPISSEPRIGFMPAGALAVANGYFSGDTFSVTVPPLLPWSHLIGNRDFGTLLTDRSLGYTFALNAHENRLTPWTNDLFEEIGKERLFLFYRGKCADMINGSAAVFSPGSAQYSGAFEDVCYHVRVSIPDGSCKKEISVSLTSLSEALVRVVYYCEPLLTENSEKVRAYRVINQNGRLQVRNIFNVNFPGALILSCDEAVSFCTDRQSFWQGEFFQEVLPKKELCAAAICERILRPYSESHVVFALEFESDQVLPVRPDPARVHPRLTCPDPSLNYLFNVWLPQQIEVCRIDLRTAFYQSSGAYGFRDQLQDVCALLWWNPCKTREHILRCCSRQFEEGDVLHWWHELPEGPAGVRTRCSDDFLWLAYTAAQYARHTGDDSLLDERVAYLSAPPLQADERERYFIPRASDKSGSVYEHCIKAFYHTADGPHGLPLIGSCDWNDGFSRIGDEQGGESVWLAEFYIETALAFLPLCEAREDRESKTFLTGKIKNYQSALAAHCWDGEWYCRAFFADGKKLGSRSGAEAKIDLLPQAFAVFAQLPDQKRTAAALNAAWENLVDEKAGIVHLFDPPLCETDAGYISEYPAGIRENGGQYTHAAVWFARALLEFGETQRGMDILNMINPIKRCLDRKSAEIYRTEPYALAADIYTHEGAAGHGGWTHYTGAAAWYYRTVTESLLGIRMYPDRIEIAPHLPDEWPECSIVLSVDEHCLHIHYLRSSGEKDTLPVVISRENIHSDLVITVAI